MQMICEWLNFDKSSNKIFNKSLILKFNEISRQLILRWIREQKINYSEKNINGIIKKGIVTI